MYSLDDDVNNDAGGSGIGVFKPGVNVRFMTTKGQTPLFKIMPAFDPASVQMEEGIYRVVDKLSWAPFRDPQTHALHVFARKIRTAGFIGHGKGKDGRRSDMLSPRTFATNQEGETYCPLTELFRAAEGDPRWSYLTEDKLGPDGTTVVERQPLSYPSVQLLVNLVDVTSTPPKAELGVFSASAANSLLKKSDPVGLVWQTANVPDPAILESNPLARWATGDLTNPETGPVLIMTKQSGKFGKYNIQMHKDQSGNVIRIPIPDHLLEQRYNLLDLDSIVKRQSDEDLIRHLAKLLNGVNPTTGEHEWVLLKQVFGNVVGNDVIPDPPAQGYTQGYTVPQQPAQQMPPQNVQQPAQQTPPQNVQQPGQQGPLLNSSGAAAPAMPPGAVQSPAPQTGIPTMDNPTGQAPGQPPAAPPQVPQAQSQDNSLMQQANAAAGTQPTAPQEAPAGTGENEAPVPGDQPPAQNFSPDGFLNRLNEMKSAEGNQ